VSVRVLEQVWKTSRHHGSPLLVLLALADFADDEGVAYPSIGTLAKKVRLGERVVHRIVGELAASKELRVEHAPGRVNHYRVLMEGVAGGAPLNQHSPLNGRAPTPERPATPPLNEGPPKPSLNRQGNRQVVAPTQNSPAETQCPTAPHTFTGSYSDHLENDPRHKVKPRDPAPPIDGDNGHTVRSDRSVTRNPNTPGSGDALEA
jgi:hypothetical protein